MLPSLPLLTPQSGVTCLPQDGGESPDSTSPLTSPSGSGRGVLLQAPPPPYPTPVDVEAQASYDFEGVLFLRMFRVCSCT